MWQKARIVHTYTHPEWIGRSMWIESAQPATLWTKDLETGIRIPPTRRLFLTNIAGPNGLSWIASRGLELLSEFAEDVPLVSWQDFLEGKE